MISHSLLWLCHSVLTYFVTFPFGTFLRPTHYSHCHRLYLEFIYLVPGLLRQFSRQRPVFNLSLIQFFQPSATEMIALKATWPSFSFILKYLPIMFFLKSDLLILAFKVLDLLFHFSSFVSLFPMQSALQDRPIYIPTSSHLPHSIRHLNVLYIWNYSWLSHFILPFHLSNFCHSSFFLNKRIQNQRIWNHWLYT